MKFTRIAVTCLALALAASGVARGGEPETMVILNGTATPVFFNDGDSFRVLGGPLKGAKARIATYNTLETHGAVHSWGTWTKHEMWVLAKIATLTARRGKWHCHSDGKTDTYGRMLTYCPDLAVTLVRRGLAHAMTVTDEPDIPELLTAQRKAQGARIGMWAHGIPAFIVTSTHSVEEDVNGRGTYNRLVSTDDGHSVPWKHKNHYRECTDVCHYVYTVDDSAIGPVVAYLKDDSPIANVVDSLSDERLTSVVRDYARWRIVNRVIPKDQREKVKRVLDQLASEGRFGKQTKSKGACMLHVPFERRFGGARAECMR